MRKQEWVWSLICCRIPVPSRMPLSCRRSSSGGSPGELVLPNPVIYKAPADSLQQQFVLVYNNMCVLLLVVWVSNLCAPSSGLLWKDIAPHWQLRIFGLWGRKTRPIRSSLSCKTIGQPNVPKSKSKNSWNLMSGSNMLTVIQLTS